MPHSEAKMRPYRQADKIDKRIFDLLAKYPLKENKREWKLFIRVLRSTIDIIDSELR